jgi:ATP-dependent Lon protease
MGDPRQVRHFVSAAEGAGGEALPMFPLSTVLLPGALLPLHVFESRYRVMIRECLEGDPRFGVVLISKGSEVGGGDTRCSVGTVARILRAVALPDGRSLLLVRGERRFRIAEWLGEEPYPRCAVDWIHEAPSTAGDEDATASGAAAVRRARALLSELHEDPAPGHLETAEADPETRAWTLCEMAPLTPYDRQRLLESEGLVARMALLRELSDALADDLVRLLASG